jgi:hypothetical protein
MAKSRNSKYKMKMPDIAVQKLRIRLSNSDGAGGFNASSTQYIDLSQIASIVNRRFYRQGLVWPVSGFELKDVGANSITSASVKLSKLQDNWCTNNAWLKIKSVWDEQQQLAIDQMGAESAVARFRDYKIFMDTEHVTAGFAGNKLPISGDASAFLPGEWDASQVVIPSNGGASEVEYTMKMYGSSDTGSGAKSILGGYVFSRAFPQSPDPKTPAVNTSWLNEVMDYGNVNDEVITNAVDNNDQLPYSQSEYPGQPTNGGGAQYHDQMLLTGTTISGTDHAPGGAFQCGLIRLDLAGFSTTQLQEMDLIINLVPGDQRGYATVRMEDF